MNVIRHDYVTTNGDVEIAGTLRISYKRRGRTPLQFKKVLVPFDFSECSRVGLDYALGVAREFQSSLLLFHAVIVQPYALDNASAALHVPNLIKVQEEYAEEEMEKLRRELARK